MINIHKIILYTFLFLIIYWAFFFWNRVFKSQLISHDHDHLIDDKDFAIPPPSTQSSLDTTEVDLKISEYFSDIISWSEAFTKLWGFDFLWRIEEMCLYYWDICDKIDFEEKTHVSDQYVYILFSTYLISQVDRNIILPWVVPLRQTIHSILFYSDEKKSRWQAGHHNVLINIHSMESQREIFEVMTHEIAWHILDLGWIQDKDSKKHTTFTEFESPSFWIKDRSLKFYQISWESEATRKSTSSRTNFVSWYSSHSPFEDFAEFTNARINHHYPLLMRTKKDPIIRQKYILFSQLFWRRHINSDKEWLTSYNHDVVPYDTTRWESTQY